MSQFLLGWKWHYCNLFRVTRPVDAISNELSLIETPPIFFAKAARVRSWEKKLRGKKTRQDRALSFVNSLGQMFIFYRVRSMIYLKSKSPRSLGPFSENSKSAHQAKVRPIDWWFNYSSLSSAATWMLTFLDEISYFAVLRWTFLSYLQLIDPEFKL